MPPDDRSVDVWVHTQGGGRPVDGTEVRNSLKEKTFLSLSELDLDRPGGNGIVVAATGGPDLRDFLRAMKLSPTDRLLVVLPNDQALGDEDAWGLMQSGASDVLIWDRLSDPGAAIAERFRRWREVDDLVDSSLVKKNMIGVSEAWRAVLRRLVEVARFTDAPVLLQGETGTGKELAARMVHTLNPTRSKGELVVVDCTTIVAELSGSELFGHERGAFTGAVAAREGAFSLANNGTLFLDEVGDLPSPLQPQLLRALQEHTYKRVGSNVWHPADFRLISATNRDLRAEEASGHFRRDLYHRVATWTVEMPPLRQRSEDILPLVHHFMRAERPKDAAIEVDPFVEVYLAAREYPGNVRDLRNLVSRIMARHAGAGPVTMGDIPPEERPQSFGGPEDWLDGAMEQAVRRALNEGMGLRTLRQAVERLATRVALQNEGGSVRRAAEILNVSDRALQKRRSNERHERQRHAGATPPAFIDEGDDGDSAFPLVS